MARLWLDTFIIVCHHDALSCIQCQVRRAPKGFVNFIFHKKSNENVKKYVKQKVNYPQTKTRHINCTFYSVTSLNLYWNSFAKPINRITKSFSGFFLFQRSRTIPIKVYFSFDMITIELYISFLPAYLIALINLYHMWTFSSVN